MFIFARGLHLESTWFLSFNRMLIGAPLDQNRQPGTNRSGALWQCPLSTYTRDCTQVITDGRLSMSPIYFSIIFC